MSKFYNDIRERFREDGHFTGGLTTAQTSFGDTVETSGRDSARLAVPPHPSDTNAVGVDNLMLTALNDVPTPGGTRAWIS